VTSMGHATMASSVQHKMVHCAPCVTYILA
jgi:hypothetical protein